MELGSPWRWAMALAREPAVVAAGLFGGMWTALVVLLGSQWAPHWFGLLPMAPVPLAGAVFGGVVVHAIAFRWAQRQGWWVLPAALMAADGLTGLLGGGLIAAYSLVLTPALLGFPGLSSMVLDLAPPYSTVIVTTVTLWALVGIAAIGGGVTGLGGAVAGYPVQLLLWGLLMAIVARRRTPDADAVLLPVLDGERRAA
jgi:hypothetical protein